MPARLLPRLAGTAYDRPSGRCRRWRGPLPPNPHPFPSALLPGKHRGRKATPPPSASGVQVTCLSYLLKLFAKFVLAGPGKRQPEGLRGRDLQPPSDPGRPSRLGKSASRPASGMKKKTAHAVPTRKMRRGPDSHDAPMPPQHSTMLTASPPSLVSLNLLLISLPVSPMALMTASSVTLCWKLSSHVAISMAL